MKTSERVGRSRQLRTLRFVGLMGAVATGWFIGPAFLLNDLASASDCPTSYVSLASPAQNGRGVRVGRDHPGMYVRDYNISCARASTIAVVNSAETRFVEIGWYEENVNASPCPQTSGPPRVLRAKGEFFVYTCDQTTAEIQNTPRNDDFYVFDANQDGTWSYYRNGNFLGTYNLGPFVTGDPRSNGERKTDHDDTAYSNFRGLYRLVNFSDWRPWEGTQRLAQTDPFFRACIRTQIHVEVQAEPC